MTDFNYKKYSLENLSNWMHDAMSCGDATPQEIYDVIKGVVEENYYIYKQKTSEAYELLSLLNGNGKGHVKEYDDCVDKILSCDKDDPSPECQGAWNDFWEDVDQNHEYNLREVEYYNKRVELDAEYEAIRSAGGYEWTPGTYVSEDGDIYRSKDKVVKWQLPVELEPSGECFVTFPDDLLQAANLKEGDNVEWVDNKDGSYTLRKVKQLSRGESYDDFENPCDMVKV